MGSPNSLWSVLLRKAKRWKLFPSIRLASRAEESATFLSKRPDGKYFRFCEPYSLSLLTTQCCDCKAKAASDNMQNGCGCFTKKKKILYETDGRPHLASGHNLPVFHRNYCLPTNPIRWWRKHSLIPPSLLLLKTHEVWFTFPPFKHFSQRLQMTSADSKETFSSVPVTFQLLWQT